MVVPLTNPNLDRTYENNVLCYSFVGIFKTAIVHNLYWIPNQAPIIKATAQIHTEATIDNANGRNKHIFALKERKSYTQGSYFKY